MQFMTHIQAFVCPVWKGLAGELYFLIFTLKVFLLLNYKARRVMKYVKLTTVFLAFCVIVLPSFTKENAPTEKNVVSAKPHVKLVYKSIASSKKNLYLTLYVWFDAWNDFLELNLVDAECSWTGFDQFNYSPFTVQ